jgi:hypothetical protein
LTKRTYGKEKEKEFLPTFNKLVNEYQNKITTNKEDSFLDKWYTQHIRDEIQFVFDELRKLRIPTQRKLLA